MPSALASCVALSASQWSTTRRLIIHIAAARLPAAQWMYAGSLPADVIVSRNLSATAGSGDWPLNGMLKKRMPAVFAAAASVSISAPGSFGWRRLMIDANPSFLISGTASAFVAPPHATVVWRRITLIAPGTSALVTCAVDGRAPSTDMTTIRSDKRTSMGTACEKECPSYAGTPQGWIGGMGRTGGMGHGWMVGRPERAIQRKRRADHSARPAPIQPVPPILPV